MANILLCIYHIFFIHLRVDGHLGCPSWVDGHLAIVNNAAVNIGVHISFVTKCFCFPWINAQE